MSRFVTIYFPHLVVEGMIRRHPDFENFVVAAPDHGRMRITAVSPAAGSEGIHPGMAVADARALVAGLQVIDDQPGFAEKILSGLGHWANLFTPSVTIDPPDGLTLDASGCTHLWYGEQNYLEDIQKRLKAFGYTARMAMAGTIGAAWALARYSKETITIIPTGQERSAILDLPPAALRLEPMITDRLHKLGMYTIAAFLSLDRNSLRRRFGKTLLERIDQAIGCTNEFTFPLQPIKPYQQCLPCLEPVVTRYGIELALQQLLDSLCGRLVKEGKGLRKAIFKARRIDGITLQIDIGTHLASNHPEHLFKLFEQKIDTIEPALGIELFLLEASVVEKVRSSQEAIWHHSNLSDQGLAELLDQLTGKLGKNAVHRYLPDEHYWPERSFKEATSLKEEPTTSWPDRPRPVRLLRTPEPVQVAAPIPDYPPMHFRHRGKLHKIKKADGPERIEAEWWIQDGEHRDYYIVENEAGERFWIFRLGHYDGSRPHQWFLHGYFA
ncbi:MAG TPA: DNA polymerase Y family protein [Niabella sp.]